MRQYYEKTVTVFQDMEVGLPMAKLPFLSPAVGYKDLNKKALDIIVQSETIVCLPALLYFSGVQKHFHKRNNFFLISEMFLNNICCINFDNLKTDQYKLTLKREHFRGKED